MTKEKKCTKCGEVKGLECFSKKASGKFGVRSGCKGCVRIYKLKNRQSILEYHRGYYKANKGSFQGYNRKNKGALNAHTAKRYARKCNATPKWLTEQQDLKIKLYYKVAKALENMDGVKRHVDHIVPLKGKGVRGLHVPWNLQILTAEQNTSKSNSYSDW